MDLKDILTISGQPGLFKLVSQGNNAVIVENLDTGKRMPASARLRISSLEDIAIFTDSEDVPLKDVFKKIFEHQNGEQLANLKKMSGEEIKALFTTLLPDYDRERVYTSDMKKAIQWYNALIAKGLITKESLKEEEQEAAPESQEESAPEAPEKE